MFSPPSVFTPTPAVCKARFAGRASRGRHLKSARTFLVFRMPVLTQKFEDRLSARHTRSAASNLLQEIDQLLTGLTGKKSDRHEQPRQVGIALGTLYSQIPPPCQEKRLPLEQ